MNPKIRNKYKIKNKTVSKSVSKRRPHAQQLRVVTLFYEALSLFSLYLFHCLHLHGWFICLSCTTHNTDAHAPDGIRNRIPVSEESRCRCDCWKINNTRRTQNLLADFSQANTSEKHVPPTSQGAYKAFPTSKTQKGISMADISFYDFYVFYLF